MRGLGKKIFIFILLLSMLFVVWATTFTKKSDSEIQNELYEMAKANIEKDIYITTIPLLEEAISYDTILTEEIEEETKKVYLKLIDQDDFRNRYISLCRLQMSREDATDDIFIELFNFYRSIGKYKEALDVLNEGVLATGSQGLSDLFEKNRYEYTLSRYVYEDATKIFNNHIIVKTNGKWGLSKSNGEPVIEGQYDNMSNFSMGKSIVEKGGEISAIDINNNRVALLDKDINVIDFGQLSQDRVALLIDDKWVMADSSFNLDSSNYEELKTFYNGHAAAKVDGRWGLVSLSNEFLIEPIFDDIIIDEIGIAYRQNCLFVKQNDKVYLLSQGVLIDEAYEDAIPYNNDGYAAVKKDGKWGFIDNKGNLVIPFKYKNAYSFSFGLAPVELEEGWGYINEYDDIVIEGKFMKAKEFDRGYAFVLTEEGYRSLSLKYIP